jgi:hypothetical protein
VVRRGGEAALFLGQAFQTAYVTTDLDRAIDVFGTRYDAGRYLRTGRFVQRLESGAEMVLEIALGWVGERQIEIIQPLAGEVEIYRRALPERGFAVRFHHIGVQLRSARQWDDLRSQASRLGHRVAMAFSAPNAQGVYLDTWDELGHYLEYVHIKDMSLSNFSKLPQNVPGHQVGI